MADVMESAVAEPDSATALRASAILKHFGPIRAVEGVDFECRAGEVHALVGENGAGKSTLGKIIAGSIVADEGEVYVDRELLTSGSIRAAHEKGVFCAYQELSLIPDWTVAENMVLVDTPPNRFFSRSRAAREAREILKEAKLGHIDPEAVVGDLPLADRQQVEIARSMAEEPRILVLDEASSALSPPGVAWLFELIRRQTARGAAVIYVSHRLNEIKEIADRVTVMRDGKIVAHFDRGVWDEEELINAMAGEAVEKTYPVLKPPAEKTVLRVEGLRATGLNNISFSLRAGEILGIGGLQGHGQTELMLALYGALPAAADRWELNGHPVGHLTPVRAVKSGLALVPEDRRTQGLSLGQSVGENLVAPWMRMIGLGGDPLVRRNGSWIDRVIRTLSVKTESPGISAGTLSGGNQQKVVFGRWLERNRSVVLLHDPTRGIDVRAKRELYAAIADLAAAGVGIVWFSTEVEELTNVCHRVLVLSGGSFRDELEGDQLTAEAVVGAFVTRKESA